MRFRGQNYTGKGVRVAVIDSGIDATDPRMKGANIEGISIRMKAMGHIEISEKFEDQNGHGTQMAAAIRRIAPDATLFAVKVMGERLRTNAELMGAGIELSSKYGCQVINLSIGTEKAGQAMALRDCVGNAMDQGSLVIATTHPQGRRYYPSEFPEVAGTHWHPKVPLDRFYYFDKKRFPKKDWGLLSGKFIAHSHDEKGKDRGPPLATAHLSGYAACLAEALAGYGPELLTKYLRRASLVPNPNVGYE